MPTPTGLLRSLTHQAHPVGNIAADALRAHDVNRISVIAANRVFIANSPC